MIFPSDSPWPLKKKLLVPFEAKLSCVPLVTRVWLVVVHL